jgi:hypothetical protein
MLYFNKKENHMINKLARAALVLCPSVYIDYSPSADGVEWWVHDGHAQIETARYAALEDALQAFVTAMRKKRQAELNDLAKQIELANSVVKQ